MHLLGRISPAPLPLFFSPFILCVFSTEDPCPRLAALSFSPLPSSAHLSFCRRGSPAFSNASTSWCDVHALALNGFPLCLPVMENSVKFATVSLK